jgi:hypothetical protein
VAVNIQSNGGADFRALAAKFKAAGKNGAAVRKATTKAVTRILSRITDEQKAQISAWQTGGVAGRGSVRREAFTAAKAKRRLNMKGRATRARKSHSLRSYVRGAIRSRVAYTGYKIGAKVYVDSSALPPSQRKLPAHIDDPKGWRHPPWGHRTRKWAHQYGTPYFRRPIERHRASVARDVQAEVDKVMRNL